MPHEKQKEIFNRLVKESALEFSDIKDKIDPNNLVDTFKTDENEPKDFRNFQMSLKVFEDLRDVEINPKEVLKYQASFESDLRETKIGSKKSPNQKNTIKFTRKKFDFLAIILFCYLKLSAKQNMEKGIKY